MPFDKKIETRTGAVIATWNLTESESELKSLMNKLELTDDANELAAIKVEKKRKQWMAARLLLKELVPTFEEITYDPIFFKNEMLPKLQSFYEQYYRPFLASKCKKQESPCLCCQRHFQ